MDGHGLVDLLFSHIANSFLQRGTFRTSMSSTANAQDDSPIRFLLDQRLECAVFGVRFWMSGLMGHGLHVDLAGWWCV